MESYGKIKSIGRPSKHIEATKRPALRELKTPGSSSRKVVSTLWLDCHHSLITKWANRTGHLKYKKRNKSKPTLKKHHRNLRFEFDKEYVVNQNILQHIILGDENKI